MLKGTKSVLRKTVALLGQNRPQLAKICYKQNAKYERTRSQMCQRADFMGIYDTFLSAKSPKTDNIQRTFSNFFGILALRNDQILPTPSYVTVFHAFLDVFSAKNGY